MSTVQSAVILRITVIGWLVKPTLISFVFPDMEGVMDVAFCGKCGSPVKAGNMYCDHCGATIETASLALDKQESVDNGALANQLKELASALESLESVITETEKVSAQQNIAEPRKPRTATNWWGMKVPVIIGIIIAFFGFAFLVSSNGSIGFIVFSVIVLVIGISLIVLGIISGGKRAKKFNEAEITRYNTDTQKRNELLVNSKNRLEELNASKVALVEKIQSLMIFNGKELNIPDDYFYAEAIRFFASRIETNRSRSIAEAMDAFDEYVHRLKLEQGMEQSAKNLAAVRRSNAINAAVNIVDTVHHW